MGHMIRCCLCANWCHEACVGIESEADRGVLWPCPECRKLSSRLGTVLDLVTNLTAVIATLTERLDTTEQNRIKDSEALTLANEKLATKNDTLLKNVIDLSQQVKALTWKSFRKAGQHSSVLLGSSIIRDVDAKKLVDTVVIAKSGAKISEVTKEVEKLVSGYDMLTLVVGGNDCDKPTDDSTSVTAIIEQYGNLIDAAHVKAKEVTVSSICPRIKSTATSQRIQALNAGLVPLCEEKGARFVDHTPTFTLGDGTVNDGYLHADGVHVTSAAMNRMARSLHLPIKDRDAGVCREAKRTAPVLRRDQHNITRPPPKARNYHDEDGWSTVRHDNRRQDSTGGPWGTKKTSFNCNVPGHKAKFCDY